ncbi:hypothetical protein A3709_20645 [Halioglobus sp. HI00S01]|uniref:hypothetical protein n=1 Tax=Halioglobus sp. HI00S01 TaxID=1822214 RepID=UPI0007C2BBDB|nr:hypothetical protein [Halioglobus sp. HI00S01]KZX58023.1 hypothetical protein A3709_20645 [Halioglobus sp. HI00S01]
MQLDLVASKIDAALGPSLPFTDRPVTQAEIDVLDGVFQNDGFIDFQQDEANRIIVKMYLLNAVTLGMLSAEQFAGALDRLSKTNDLTGLALRMVMSSVEDAADVVSEGLELDRVRQGDEPSHLKLVNAGS